MVVVSKKKVSKYKGLFNSLNTREKKNTVYRLAKAREKKS